MDKKLDDASSGAPERAPKPQAEVIRPEITKLPDLTIFRRVYRLFVRGLIRLVVRLCTRTTTQGLENIPRQGPALMVSNHLGDADLIVGLAFSPVEVEFISKAELHDYPILGRLMDAYGAIWVHRGHPDRRALRAALECLRQKRIVAIAPEARESLTGALEKGTGGAAYIALRADVPVVPVAFTGTENARVYGNLKRLHKTDITLTIGPAFRLEHLSDRREGIDKGTQKIMREIASLLPAEYRGVYTSQDESGQSSLQSLGAED